MARRTGQLLFDKLRDAPGGGSELPPREFRAGDTLQSPITDRPVLSQNPVRSDSVARPAEHLSSQTSPWVAVRGRSLVLTLSSTSAGIAVFLALLLLSGAYLIGSSVGERRGQERGFKLGRDSYTSSTIDEIEKARQLPPSPQLLGGLLRDEPVATPERSGNSSVLPETSDEASVPEALPESGIAWVGGYNYIVAQEFDGQASQEAESARLFLSENEVPAAVVRLRSGKLATVVLEGFNLKEPTQRRRADLLKEKVARLGSKYFSAGGRYKLEGYFAAYKSGAWE